MRPELVLGVDLACGGRGGSEGSNMALGGKHVGFELCTEGCGRLETG